MTLTATSSSSTTDHETINNPIISPPAALTSSHSPHSSLECELLPSPSFRRAPEWSLHRLWAWSDACRCARPIVFWRRRSWRVSRLISMRCTCLCRLRRRRITSKHLVLRAHHAVLRPNCDDSGSDRRRCTFSSTRTTEGARITSIHRSSSTPCRHYHPCSSSNMNRNKCSRCAFHHLRHHLRRQQRSHHRQSIK